MVDGENGKMANQKMVDELNYWQIQFILVKTPIKGKNFSIFKVVCDYILPCVLRFHAILGE